ncbi:hypothetical protein RR42_s2865 [Cupriavidus basilensis]|uniref:Uncharacterized protein n=1 Tax=Cupriavidus basilensis TaxID=68895 RepID=A0A0C4YV45_9BURK|nr:hypothetical protein RR42_s2865 [Cupriavidus basilensis]
MRRTRATLPAMAAKAIARSRHAAGRRRAGYRVLGTGSRVLA